MPVSTETQAILEDRRARVRQLLELGLSHEQTAQALGLGGFYREQ